MQAVETLKEKFSESILNESICAGQTTVQVKKESLVDLLLFLKSDFNFRKLIDLTAVDYIKETKVLYWLENPTTLERIRIIVSVMRGEKLPSVIELWPGANWYERELFDMFGVGFLGHPDLKRILMPDHWVGHPMRRDYALGEEPVEFKYGVKPKCPSEIIPHVK